MAAFAANKTPAATVNAIAAFIARGHWRRAMARPTTGSRRSACVGLENVSTPINAPATESDCSDERKRLPAAARRSAANSSLLQKNRADSTYEKLHRSVI